MRRILLIAVLAAICMGQGCPAPSAPSNSEQDTANSQQDTSSPSGQVLPPAPQTQTPSTPTCNRVFRNELYGFGIDPPPGTAGPYGNPANTTKLFWAEWQDGVGRRYVADVSNLGGASFQDVIQLNRTAILQGGGSILQDRAVTFTSGEIGWVIESSYPSGTAIDVFQFRSGLLFNAGVFPTTGATVGQSQIISNFISSLCVDP